jgi:hypothetical protein
MTSAPLKARLAGTAPSTAASFDPEAEFSAAALSYSQAASRQGAAFSSIAPSSVLLMPHGMSLGPHMEGRMGEEDSGAPSGYGSEPGSRAVSPTRMLEHLLQGDISYAAPASALVGGPLQRWPSFRTDLFSRTPGGSATASPSHSPSGSPPRLREVMEEGISGWPGQGLLTSLPRPSTSPTRSPGAAAGADLNSPRAAREAAQAVAMFSAAATDQPGPLVSSVLASTQLGPLRRPGSSPAGSLTTTTIYRSPGSAGGRGSPLGHAGQGGQDGASPHQSAMTWFAPLAGIPEHGEQGVPLQQQQQEGAPVPAMIPQMGPDGVEVMVPGWLVSSQSVWVAPDSAPAGDQLQRGDAGSGDRLIRSPQSSSPLPPLLLSYSSGGEAGLPGAARGNSAGAGSGAGGSGGGSQGRRSVSPASGQLTPLSEQQIADQRRSSPGSPSRKKKDVQDTVNRWVGDQARALLCLLGLRSGLGVVACCSEQQHGICSARGRCIAHDVKGTQSLQR